MKRVFVGKEKAGQTVMSMWSPRGERVLFYSPEEFEKVADEIAALPDTHQAFRNVKRLCLGTVETLTVDQDGYAQIQDPAGFLSLVESGPGR